MTENRVVQHIWSRVVQYSPMNDRRLERPRLASRNRVARLSPSRAPAGAAIEAGTDAASIEEGLPDLWERMQEN